MTFKDRFLANADFSKKHADAVASEWFQEAMRTALLDASMETSLEDDAVKGHYMQRGALAFVRIFNGLSKPVTAATKKDLDNLPHL